MQRKKAGELMKEKLPIELNDQVISFSNDLPYGMRERFQELLAMLIPQLYYTDRMDDLEWLKGIDEPLPNMPLLLIYEVGITPITGYYDGDAYRNMHHATIPIPLIYRYIQLPL